MKNLKSYKPAEKGEVSYALTSDDIAEVVARMTGVPVKKVIRSEAKYLLKSRKNYW